MTVEHGKREEVFACRTLRKHLIQVHRALQLGPDVRKLAVKVASVADIHRVLDLFVEEAEAANRVASLAG